MANQKKPKETLADFIEVEETKPEIPMSKDTAIPKAVSQELAAMFSRESEDVSEKVFGVESLLSATEKELYAKRWKHYYNEFTLNKSSDVGLVHRVIMEEIIAERLYKRILKTPEDKELSEELTSSHKRYQAALEALGASRDKRIRNRETKTVSIADIAKSYFENKANPNPRYAQWEAEDVSLGDQQKTLLGLQYGEIKENAFDIGVDID